MVGLPWHMMYPQQMKIWYVQHKAGDRQFSPIGLFLVSISFSKAAASLPLFAAGQPCHSLLTQQHLAALPWHSPWSLMLADNVHVHWKRTEGTQARNLSQETISVQDGQVGPTVVVQWWTLWAVSALFVVLFLDHLKRLLFRAPLTSCLNCSLHC